MNLQQNPDVSIIIACYNEEPHLKANVDEIISIMDCTNFSYELIFIDDKSRDKTPLLIKEIREKYHDRHIEAIFHSENVGRGGTVAEGIQVASADIVGFLDIDLEVHARYLPSLILAIQQGADVVILQRIYKFNLLAFHRHVLSHGYSWLVKRFLKIPFNDTESGFKFFRKSKILPVLKETKDKGWFWDTEIAFNTFRHNLKVVEIPGLFIRNNTKKSTVRIFKDSWDYVRKLLSLKYAKGSRDR